ncbi:BF3164 family lipoprotein [Fulvivirgaceae bacterium LMO-SS25]
MKICKLALITLTYVLLFSCSEEEKEVINLELEGKVILEDEVKINKLISLDSILLGFRLDDDYYFSLYNSKTYMKYGEVLKRGNGPNEFNSPIRVHGMGYENQELFLWFHDINEVKLHRLNVTKSLMSAVTIIDKTLKIPTNPDPLSIRFINDSIIVFNNSNLSLNVNQLNYYNLKSDSLFKEIQFDLGYEKQSQEVDYIQYTYNLIYVNVFEVKPDKDKIATVYQYQDQVDLVNREGVRLSRHTNSTDYANKSMEFLTSRKRNALNIYYKAVEADDNFIYALYYNQPSELYLNQHHNSSIHVFDWDLNLIAEIKLKDYLLNFSLNKEQGTIVGYDYFNEKLLEYEINEVVRDLL